MERQKNQVWKDYIAWLEKNNKAKLMRFCFRYKPEGWKAYPGYAEFDSHKKLINTPETSVFSKLHLSAYSIEKGCFQCPFASEERNGDITLGIIGELNILIQLSEIIKMEYR